MIRDKILSFVFFLCAASILLWDVRDGRTDELKLQPGDITEALDELTEADENSDGKFRKSYRVQLEKGRTYEFELLAVYKRFFDPYLFLQDSTGRILAQDDNRGGEPNARITYEATKSGYHDLIVTTFPSGQTGAYRLKVGEVGARLQPVVLKLQNDQARFEGVITKQDALVDLGRKKNNKQCCAFTCEFTKGKTYHIRLLSPEFDPYLYLQSPKGKQLTEDDDSAGGLNAQMLWTATESGPHRLFASSLNGMETGGFHLSIAEVAANHALPLKLAKNRGAIVSDISADAPMYDGKPSRACTVYLTKGRTYQIDLLSDEFDPYLYLLGPDGVKLAEDDDGGEKLDARIVHRAKISGVYRIQASSLNKQGKGIFLLKLQEKLPEIDVTKAAKLPWQGGQANVKGKLLATSPIAFEKPSNLFVIELKQGQKYQIDLVSADFDAFLYLVGPNRQVVALDDDSGGGLNARIVHSAVASGSYYVFASSLGPPNDGNYALTVMEKE